MIKHKITIKIITSFYLKMTLSLELIPNALLDLSSLFSKYYQSKASNH